MAVAMLFTISGEAISEADYERVAERVNVRDDPPAGLILHTTGFANGVARTFDVWDSEESFQTFMRERLQPELERANVGGSSPEVTIYPLHNLWAVDPDELERLSYEASPIAAQRGG